MHIFLTLLASIASLSAHTFLGVHATQCAVCPQAINNQKFIRSCPDVNGATHCYYPNNIICVFDKNGKKFGGNSACPQSVKMTSTGCASNRCS